MSEMQENWHVKPDLSVVYAKRAERDLELHVFRPQGAVGMRPGVLFVHGGGWSGGRWEQFRWHAAQLAAQGFVAASMSYRLSGEATWPAQLDDCQQAVRWMRSHSDEIWLDASKIAAVGSSAGGHLVACLGVRDTREAQDVEMPDVSSRVQAVVDVHGLHDCPACAQQSIAGSVTKLCGGDFASCPQLWQDASPVRFIDQDTAPMFVLHDPDDKTVDYHQSRLLVDALVAGHRPVRFDPTPGSGHGYVYSPSNPWTQRIWPWIVSWLKDQLF